MTAPQPRGPGRRTGRWVVPLVVAAAVAVLLAGVGWLVADAGSDGQPAAAPSVPARAEPVPIDSYHRADARHLALHYTIGVPECYGTIREPRVVETERRVTVTLVRVPPADAGERACIEIALRKSVRVTLDQPLGGRRIVDGSAPERRLQEATPYAARSGPAVPQ